MSDKNVKSSKKIDVSDYTSNKLESQEIDLKNISVDSHTMNKKINLSSS